MPKKRHRQHCHCGNFLSRDGICRRCNPSISHPDAVAPADTEVSGVATETYTAPDAQRRVCQNCYRRDMDEYGREFSNISIQFRPTTGLNFRKHLSSISEDPIRPSEVCICDECQAMLTVVEDEGTSHQYKWVNCWPSFFWKMFIEPVNAEHAVLIWKYLPCSMRLCWLESFTSIGPRHGQVNLNEPRSYFEDITDFADHMEALVATGDLAKVMESCNKNHYCSVRCPWGCTEYPDNCGYISFNKLLFAFLKDVKKPLNESGIHDQHYPGRKSSKCLVGIRPDYLLSQTLFLESVNHPVRPCIRFVAGKGPLLCTCKDHEGGCDKQYLHPPVNPVTGTKPCSDSDQLAHAVIAPRMITTIKTNNKKSDTYQMQRAYGGFRGVDSCDIMHTGRFDKGGLLAASNLSLSLFGRPDIRAKLSQLVEAKKVTSAYAAACLHGMEDMERSLESDNFESSRKGSTFVSLTDAMKMMTHEEQCSKLPIVPLWPLALIQCQPSVSEYGCSPCSIPPFRVQHDLRLPWFLLSMATSVPALWECIVNSVTYVRPLSWHGWLLSHATKTVLDGCRGSRSGSKGNHPYKGSLTPRKLAWKLETYAEDIESSPPEEFSPEFTLVKLQNCLTQVNNVVTYETVQELTDALTGEGVAMPSSTEVVVLVGCRGSGALASEFIAHFSENHSIKFELVYVANTNATEGHRNQWTAETYSRTVGKELPYLWKSSRGSDPVEIAVEGTIADIDIAVWVRSALPNADRLRQDYLTYMDSNVVSKCPIHDFPLTTAPLRTGRTCSALLNTGPCVKAAAYECPFCLCRTYLCKSCIGITLPRASNISLPQGDDVDEDEESESNESMSTVWDVLESEILSETKDGSSKASEGIEFSDNDSIGSTQSMFSSDEFILPEFATEYEPFDVQMFDITYVTDQEIDGNEGNSEEAMRQIPTTNAGMTPPTIEIGSDERKDRFPMHVLMNEHGSLLLRSNRHLKPSRPVKGFLERIVATAKGQSIPLLYPEAMMFPSIFWHQRQDGSYDGAIPIGLWNGNKAATNFGYASLPEHMRSRVKNSSLLCSTDPKYIYFAFDTVNNVMSEGTDNRWVLKRGFEHMLGPTKVLGESSDSMLSSDMLDSRRNVMKLAAMVREQEPTYFYTHTCNQTEHFGIAPLKQLLNDKLQELESRRHLYNDAEYEEIRLSYHHQVSTQIIRTWFKVGRIYMKYILTSHEKPLGTIVKHWWRWEYQDANGNLPHIHCLLWTKENKHNPDDLRKLQERIRCSVRSFFTSPQEAEAFAHNGLLPDATPYTLFSVLDSVRKIQTHSCVAANYRCMRRVGCNEGDLQCRVPDYFVENPQPRMYGYKKINPNHWEKAMELFKKLGLYDEQGVCTDPCFAAGRYVYPADRGEHFSPCNARLFLAHRSSDNLLLTDTYFSCRYLAKYVQGLDENCKVDVKAGKGGKDKMVLQEQQIANTKITTGNIMEKKRQHKRRQNPNYSGRALGLPEAVALLLREPQVFTSMNFVSIPTVTLEQRPAHERIARTEWCTDIREEAQQTTRQQEPIGRGSDNFIGRRMRMALQLPVERQFTIMEETIIRDILQSPLSIDTISLFACRPPELRFIDSPTLYFTCFTRLNHRQPKKSSGKTTTEELLSPNVLDCGWVDGVDCQVLVKPMAISKILAHPGCTGQINLLFQCLNYIVYGVVENQEVVFDALPPDLAAMEHLFVDSKYGYDTLLPLPIYNVIKPSQGNRFLIHLLLSMGKFSNEGELFAGAPSMATFFRNAQLLPQQGVVQEADVLLLVKRFITEQLLFVPGGTRTFDHCCITAYEMLRSTLIEGSMVSMDVPSYLYTTLIQDATATTLLFHNTMRANMSNALANALSCISDFPSPDQLDKASKTLPLDWEPQLQRLDGQDEASYLECCAISRRTAHGISNYVLATPTVVKSLIICGGPGSGKTFQLQVAAAYAMSKGLSVAITACMSERAISLGGRHIHYLFGLPGDAVHNIHRIVDKAIRTLIKNPERLQFLRTLDVLCIDEIGYLSAEILNVMDTLLRYARAKASFMGGVLVFATLDHKQLPPIRSRPMLLSTLAMTSFDMVKMEHFVRARNDPDLQQMVRISRTAAVTHDDIETFKSIVVNKCRHVQTWNDESITPDMVRILGTRKGVMNAEAAYYEAAMKHKTIVTRTAETVQAIASRHGNWSVAEQQVIEQMNREVNELQDLHLHQYMMVECTYNKENSWSNSQVGMLLELPSQDDLNSWKPIPIMLGPVGTKKLPPGALTRANLQQHGWKEVHVGTAPELEHRLTRGISAKRKQYGIRPRIAMTIHRAMGSDIGQVITSVGTGNDGNKLWLKEQVIVLISRTHMASDLIFVGNNAENTAQVMVNLLLKASPFAAYMEHMVEQMSSTDPQHPPVLRPLQYLPYNVRNTIIPTNTNGFVYLLMSVRDFSSTYIGQTVRLAERIDQHNRGVGAAATANALLRPWHCIAFVTGFCENDNERRRNFESCWQAKRRHQGHYVLNPWDVMEIGKEMVQAHNVRYPSNQLVFTQCLEFRC